LNPKNSRYLNELGVIFNTLGEFQEAVDYHEKALAIDTEIYGDRHPKVAVYLNNLGLAWKALGKYQKAMDYYKRAESIFKIKLGEDHPYTKSVREHIESMKTEK
jgi:tetratricopeptide (TPR) repeat protein